MQRQRVSRAPAALDKSISENFAEGMHRLGLWTHKFPPFDSIGELDEARREAGLDVRDPDCDAELPLKLAISLECLSIFHIYLSACAMTVLVTLLDQKRKSPKLQAALSLISGMATDVAAIELLARTGFDIQAKGIVRSLREKLDALVASQLDRSFAVSFVTANDSDDANRFWHSRVSRGKLLKNIGKRLSHYSADAQSPIDKLWLGERKRLDRWLGEAVHPSHATGILALFPTFGQENSSSSDVGLYGQPSELSVPTARAVLSLAWEIIFLARARNLIPKQKPTSGDKDINEPFETIYQGLEAAEKFLIKCTAESTFAPNVDLHKLMLYLDGYVMMPIEGSFDHKEYLQDILRTMIQILETARARLKEKIDSKKTSRSISEFPGHNS